MRYWRDPDTFDVIRSNLDAPADPGDVVVIPADDWRKLVELVEWVLPECLCAWPCDTCRENATIKAIIQRAEGVE